MSRLRQGEGVVEWHIELGDDGLAQDPSVQNFVVLEDFHVVPNFSKFSTSILASEDDGCGSHPVVRGELFQIGRVTLHAIIIWPVEAMK